MARTKKIRATSTPVDDRRYNRRVYPFEWGLEPIGGRPMNLKSRAYLHAG